MRLRIGGYLLHTNITPRHLLSAVALFFILIVLYTSQEQTHESHQNDNDNRHRRGIDIEDSDRKHEDLRYPVGGQVRRHQQERLVAREDVVADTEYDAAMRQTITDWVEQRHRLRPVQLEILAHPRPPDSVYNINVSQSDHISLDRDILDSRPKVCRSKTYDSENLPTASVVIPFYNEALSMLLRTIHSILGRSPDHLLEEIILVDDFSARDNLKEPLDKYVKLLPKVILLRNPKREGLIRSRMRGANLSKGQVVIFLDAHTEANVGWLEPILSEIKLHPDSVVQPFIDGIEEDTIEYTKPPTIYKGGFSWDLRYIWWRIPDHEQERIFEDGHSFWTPTLVGCAIAVDKSYFNKIGAFDEALEVWGGENIELAWRAWMCGGRVLTVTCSRVGHIFKQFPYRFGKGDKDKIVEKNLMRVAETWMGSYKKYFYASTRIYEFKRVKFTHDDLQTLQKRIKLRDKLKCKNFDWYMSNIVPDVSIPPMDAVYYGEIQNKRSDLCFEVLHDGVVGTTFHCFTHKIILRNIFYINKKGLLQWRDRCVRMASPKTHLIVDECPHDNYVDEYGKWTLINKGHTWGLLNLSVRLKGGKKQSWCIRQVTSKSVHYKNQIPQAVPCNKEDRYQYWKITYKFDFTV